MVAGRDSGRGKKEKSIKQPAGLESHFLRQDKEFCLGIETQRWKNVSVGQLAWTTPGVQKKEWGTSIEKEVFLVSIGSLHNIPPESL